MKKATLVYKDYNTGRTVTLESTYLNYIDSNTCRYNNEDDLKLSYLDELKNNDIKLDLENSDLLLYSIKDERTKEVLPILINDEKEIALYYDFYTNTKSQIEISRKLMFNSKDKMYLKSVVDNKSLMRTLSFSVNMSYNEYQYAIKRGIKVYNEDGKYYVSVYDLFNHISNDNKLGLLRELFEDSLDIWKKRVSNLTTDDVYYYSRTLRVLQNDYYASVKALSKANKNEHIDEILKVKKII